LRTILFRSMWHVRGTTGGVAEASQTELSGPSTMGEHAGTDVVTVKMPGVGATLTAAAVLCAAFNLSLVGPRAPAARQRPKRVGSRRWAARHSFGEILHGTDLDDQRGVDDQDARCQLLDELRIPGGRRGRRRCRARTRSDCSDALDRRGPGVVADLRHLQGSAL
jgi:hypothetical protein